MKIGQLHIGSGKQVGPLTLFPVWAERRGAVGLATGAAANLEVTELTSGPTVNKLTVTNKDTKPVLLLEGELLEGGHQHRVCARDVILPAGETRDVDTYCVEQGRWGGASSHGRSARRAPLNVRAELNRPGRGAGTQSRVWERVSRFEGLNTRSSTGSLVDHLDAGTRPGVGLKSLPRPIDGQRGVVIAFGGQALMLELFGRPDLFAAHYRSLVEAAWLDIQLNAGSMRPVPTKAQSARDLAVRVMELDLPQLTENFEANLGPVTVNGVCASPKLGMLPGVAHLGAWDTRHPMMAG
ncbi:hypothetical protein LVY72_02920 [Arthrobacter sp. I2-34]|uniref:ARG and Rhodanese-Phosphatase-superfamily-associated domain-containing protein n=1 Tax=Arthrobacter hankyongi TaxID=2904801 RepID=A0ABS9L2K7_9MICC|nr:DUF6569 family protein [Arthrobacter hankyongi]MCG2620863.1 hypothetical protein [Arthrobacter hankyongi]